MVRRTLPSPPPRQPQRAMVALGDSLCAPSTMPRQSQALPATVASSRHRSATSPPLHATVMAARADVILGQSVTAIGTRTAATPRPSAQSTPVAAAARCRAGPATKPSTRSTLPAPPPRTPAACALPAPPRLRLLTPRCSAPPSRPRRAGTACRAFPPCQRRPFPDLCLSLPCCFLSSISSLPHRAPKTSVRNDCVKLRMTMY